MTTLKLNDQYQFAIEQDDKRLRLIVLNGSSEWVCRKTTSKELTAFLKGDETHLYKGRLQLNKVGDGVIVSVKGESLGLISSTTLADAI